MNEETTRACSVVGHPEVSTVIPGIRNRKQLNQNLTANDNQLESEAKKEYEEFYEENLADDDLPW